MSREILVVDNDSAVLDYISRTLASEGYNSQTADSGRKAIEILKSKKYDLLLVDSAMEDPFGTRVIGLITGIHSWAQEYYFGKNLSGYEDFRAMHKDMKIIFMNEGSDKRSSELAKYAGGERVVVVDKKPGSPPDSEQLLDAVRKHFSGL